MNLDTDYLPSRTERLTWLLGWFIEQYGAGVDWDLAQRFRGIPTILPVPERDVMAAAAISEYVNAADRATPGARAVFWECFDTIQPDKEWRI